jgi:hypothetical protein
VTFGRSIGFSSTIFLLITASSILFDLMNAPRSMVFGVLICQSRYGIVGYIWTMHIACYQLPFDLE